MALFLVKRLGVMILTALCLTAIVFSLVNLKPNLVKLAKEQNSSRMSDEQVEVWLEAGGLQAALGDALRRVARRACCGAISAPRRGSARR